MFCTTCASHNHPGAQQCAFCKGELPQVDPGARNQRSRWRPGIPLGVIATPGLAFSTNWRGRPWLHSLIVVLPIVMALSAGGTLANWYQVDQTSLAERYAAAETALAEGRVSEAAAVYAEISGFRDADARRAEILTPSHEAREQATILLAVGDYDGTIALLEPIITEFPDDAEITILLDHARSMREHTLRTQVSVGTAQDDWLGTEAALVELLHDHPTDDALEVQLARIRREHSPILYARAGAILISGPGQYNERVVTNEVNSAWPVWSPDRRQIAFVSPPDPRDRYAADLYIVNTDGTNLQKVTERVLRYRWPVWSPDGTKIAYTSVAAFDSSRGTGHISTSVYDLTTGEETDYTSDFTPYAGSVTWSPTGDRFAVVSSQMRSSGSGIRLSEPDVWVIDVETGAATNLTDTALPDVWRISWSPTDERIATHSRSEGNGYGSERSMIAMLDATTGELTTIEQRSGRATLPVWSPDGSRYIYSVSGRMLRIGGGPGEVWLRLPTSVGENMSWSTDGSAIIATASEQWQPSYLITLDNLGGAEIIPLSFDSDWANGGPPQWSPRNPVPTLGMYPAHGATLDHDWLGSESDGYGLIPVAATDAVAEPIIPVPPRLT